ncbi:hypothetical protein [Kiloniella laminariae]|uniref:hypothetical protein n=1 Tax=Kiloniella laminariae TaxID=454162 RepID=UPI00035E0B9F|nr:hypothetical protein [Kiloniella laminariae]
MSVFFRIFLLFCSKDFREFYAENQRRGLIDPEVRNSIATRVLRWLLLALFPPAFAAWLFWLNYADMSREIPDFSPLSPVVVCLLIAGFTLILARRKIRLQVILAFVYSDGVLVDAQLIEYEHNNSSGSYRFQYSYIYEYRMAGEWFRKKITFRKLSSPRDEKVGDFVPFICAESCPRVAYYYDMDEFSGNCLIRDREMPGKPARWQLDERAKELEKTKKPFLYQK